MKETILGHIEILKLQSDMNYDEYKEYLKQGEKYCDKNYLINEMKELIRRCKRVIEMLEEENK